MEGRAIDERTAESWGHVYGRQCGQIHDMIPNEIIARETLTRSCAEFGRSFDEATFRVFFNAATKRAKDELDAEKMDRNEKISLHATNKGPRP